MQTDPAPSSAPAGDTSVVTPSSAGTPVHDGREPASPTGATSDAVTSDATAAGTGTPGPDTSSAAADGAPAGRDERIDDVGGTGTVAPDSPRTDSDRADSDRATDTRGTDSRDAGADAVDRAGTDPVAAGTTGVADGPRADRAERPAGRDERRPLRDRDRDDRGPRRERDDRGPRGGRDDRGPRAGRDDRRRDDRGRNDRGRNERGRDDRGRDDRPRRAIPESAERTFVAEPDLPDSVSAAELDPSVRRDLRGLQKETAEVVARHLVAAGLLVDEDPVQALEHVRYARRRASRIAVVREAAGIVAYHAGEWNEALGEFRAARRMGGGPGHVHVMADIERALGRPERALDLARSPEARDLGHEERIELLIVAAGARRDLGEADAAVVGLQVPELDAARRDPWSARLFYAYADNLLAAGRESEAVQWFVHAHDADAHRETDAAARIAELTGDELEGADDELTVGWEDVPPAADDHRTETGTDAGGATSTARADAASADSSDSAETEAPVVDGTDEDGTDENGTVGAGTVGDGTREERTGQDGTDDVRGDAEADTVAGQVTAGGTTSGAVDGDGPSDPESPAGAGSAAPEVGTGRDDTAPDPTAPVTDQDTVRDQDQRRDPGAGDR
ncbi:TPR-repeat-containing protein [Pseudonocardia sp. Ae717_Ps2]|nr:TPR-repeat-containing protein [Pseudonocardia sp. Ae717_Ps2]